MELARQRRLLPVRPKASVMVHASNERLPCRGESFVSTWPARTKTRAMSAAATATVRSTPSESRQCAIWNLCSGNKLAFSALWD
jgi:hypothetical protein